ncbi:hypothetical protein [Bacillus altitudinis]|nr:hypothetical protein [Bacillus altitudinis]
MEKKLSGGERGWGENEGFFCESVSFCGVYGRRNMEGEIWDLMLMNV